MRGYIDIENIRLFWLNRPLDLYGTLDSTSLEEALATKSGLPHYVYAFLDRYSTVEERLDHFPALVSAFFQREQETSSGFLSHFFAQERAVRLVLTALRAKKYGRDLMHELRYEDPEDDLVVQILTQKDAKSYVPPEQYESLSKIFHQYADAPLDLHKALLEQRFVMMETLIGLQIFTIDRILAYQYQLFLVHRWQWMDQREGEKAVQKLLNAGAHHE